MVFPFVFRRVAMLGALCAAMCALTLCAFGAAPAVAQESGEAAAPEAGVIAPRPDRPPLDGVLSPPLVGAPTPEPAPAAEAPVGEAPPPPGPPPAATPVAADAKALAEILKNPESRDRLIQELERLSGGAPAPEGAAAGAGESGAGADEDVSAARAMAEWTRAAAQNFLSDVVQFGRRVLNIPRAFRALTGQELEVLFGALRDLALLIAVTAATYWALRALAIPYYRSLGRKAEEADWAHKGALILFSNVVEAALVLAAWGAGYAAAHFALGESGRVELRHSLFLNAFLIVEFLKLALRVWLSPSVGALRLIAMPDRGARTLSLWLSFVVSLMGYGQLLATPIIAKNVSIFAGRAFSASVMLAALMVMILLVLSSRHAVAAWLLGRRRLNGGQGGLLTALARYWHLPALVYLIGLFVSVMISPTGEALPVISASAQMLIALLFGVVAAKAIKRRIASGVHLPQEWNDRLPSLEGRLNAVLPRTLILLRFVIIISVMAFIADTLSLIEAREWLTSQVGGRVAGAVISIGLVTLAVMAAWLALSSYVEFRLNPHYGTTPTARESTLLRLMRSAATVALIVIALMVALSELGLDIAPLIASAGVLGLAIGIGSQKLVQDVITGVFIQLESAINVGDVITVAGVTGTVEELTIRSVSLRDLEGTFHIIPFSSIDMVANFNRDYAYHLSDMGVSYGTDVDQARQAMVDAFETLRQTPKWRFYVYGDLEWFGVHAFADSAIILRSRIKCAPGQQWAVGRAFNEIVKRLFDERGIEIPFPHRTVIFEHKGPAPGAEEKGLEEKGPEEQVADENGSDAKAPPKRGEA